jgi:peroxiredoxin
LFKYVGENILDRGKGVDNANDDTFVLDGDNEIKNIFRQDEVEGDRNEGLVDYDHLNEEDIPLNL